jgi:hypothetical protein
MSSNFSLSFMSVFLSPSFCVFVWCLFPARANPRSRQGDNPSSTSHKVRPRLSNFPSLFVSFLSPFLLVSMPGRTTPRIKVSISCWISYFEEVFCSYLSNEDSTNLFNTVNELLNWWCKHVFWNWAVTKKI